MTEIQVTMVGVSPSFATHRTIPGEYELTKYVAKKSSWSLTASLRRVASSSIRLSSVVARDSVPVSVTRVQTSSRTRRAATTVPARTMASRASPTDPLGPAQLAPFPAPRSCSAIVAQASARAGRSVAATLSTPRNAAFGAVTAWKADATEMARDRCMSTSGCRSRRRRGPVRAMVGSTRSAKARALVCARTSAEHNNNGSVALPAIVARMSRSASTPVATMVSG